MPGFIKLENELVDKLIELNLSGQEMRVLLCILKNQNDNHISYSQLAETLNTDKPRIAKIMRKLISNNLLTVVQNDNGKKLYSINKDFAKWGELSKKTTVVKNDNPSKELEKSKKTKGLSKKTTPVVQKDNSPKRARKIEKNQELSKKTTPILLLSLIHI